MADLSSAYAAYNDQQLRARIDAAVWQEAFARMGSNDYADLVVRNGTTNFSSFYWRVSIDYEAAYETAVRNGRGAPGHDTDVITDANIAAAIAAVWPADVPDPAGGV